MLREEFIRADPEHLGQHEKLQIGYTSVLILQSGYRFAAGVPAQQLELCGELILRPGLQGTELSHTGANHIQF